MLLYYFFGQIFPTLAIGNSSKWIWCLFDRPPIIMFVCFFPFFFLLLFSIIRCSRFPHISYISHRISHFFEEPYFWSMVLEASLRPRYICSRLLGTHCFLPRKHMHVYKQVYVQTPTNILMNYVSTDM